MITTLLCASAFASSAPLRIQFVKGNIADKTAAVRESSGQDAAFLSREAIDFALEHKALLGNDRDLDGLALAGVLALPADSVASLDYGGREALSEKFDVWLKASALSGRTICAVADGTFCPDIGCECRSEVKADAKYAPVMAASILAKTYRDAIMIEMDKEYPAYGYARHKGYPTAEHRRICREIGPSPIQRLTFHY